MFDALVTHTLVPILELENYALCLVRDADGYIKKKSRLMDFGKERFSKCVSAIFYLARDSN